MAERRLAEARAVSAPCRVPCRVQAHTQLVLCGTPRDPMRRANRTHSHTLAAFAAHGRLRGRPRGQARLLSPPERALAELAVPEGLGLDCGRWGGAALSPGAAARAWYSMMMRGLPTRGATGWDPWGAA
jgi:hypothetical protein